MKKICIGPVSIGVNVIIYILIAVVAVRLVTYAYQFSYDVFSDQAVAEDSDEQVTVEITEGMTAKDIGELLESKGLVKSARVFEYHTKFSQYKDQIQPGTYELSPSMTMDDMLRVICNVQDSEEDAVY